MDNKNLKLGDNVILVGQLDDSQGLAKVINFKNNKYQFKVLKYDYDTEGMEDDEHEFGSIGSTFWRDKNNLGDIVKKSFNKNNMNDKKQLDSVFSAVGDSTDVWKTIREYMVSRIKQRYDTIEEMKEDVNDKFKSIMESSQTNYDNWFNNELLKNYALYDIEILGDDAEVVVEDESMNSLDENEMDLEGDDEMNDEMNDEIDLSDDTEEVKGF